MTVSDSKPTCARQGTPHHMMKDWRAHLAYPNSVFRCAEKGTFTVRTADSSEGLPGSWPDRHKTCHLSRQHQKILHGPLDLLSIHKQFQYHTCNGHTNPMKINQQENKRDPKQETGDKPPVIPALIRGQKLQKPICYHRKHHSCSDGKISTSHKNNDRNSAKNPYQLSCTSCTYRKLLSPKEK